MTKYKEMEEEEGEKVLEREEPFGQFSDGT